MKILFVGQCSPGQTSRMRMKCLERLGHEVTSIDSASILAKDSYSMAWCRRYIGNSASISAINSDVQKQIRLDPPDLLWCEKQEFIKPETLEAARSFGVTTLHYTPDPYFSLWWKRTSIMDSSIPKYDWLVTSKQYELDEYKAVSKRVMYVPLGFDERSHCPKMPLGKVNARNYFCDVSFVGGWEPRREIGLSAIARTGVSMNIWGYGWEHLVDGKWSLRRYARLRLLAGKEPFSITKENDLARSIRGGEIYSDEYAWAIAGSKISIGFLRKVCPDQHTTRTFEIPACGAMLLADRTDEHREFFKEGKEAEFFSSEQEMLDKIRFYLSNETVRQKIVFAGLARCAGSGYTYTSRVKQILAEIAV